MRWEETGRDEKRQKKLEEKGRDKKRQEKLRRDGKRLEKTKLDKKLQNMKRYFSPQILSVIQ